MKGDAVTALPKTSTQSNIVSEPSKDESTKKTKRGRKTFRIITTDHVAEALTHYLRSISTIDDNEHVEHFFKVPEGFEVKIGVIND